MNDEDLIRSVPKEQQGYSIETIEDAIIEFLEYFNIDLNQIERKQLNQYLIQYKDSKQAAAHIAPINENIKIIPNCINKIATIIDEKNAFLLENKTFDQDKNYNDLFTDNIIEAPAIETNTTEENKNRDKKLSNIYEFLENST